MRIPEKYQDYRCRTLFDFSGRKPVRHSANAPESATPESREDDRSMRRSDRKSIGPTWFLPTSCVPCQEVDGAFFGHLALLSGQAGTFCCERASFQDFSLLGPCGSRAWEGPDSVNPQTEPKQPVPKPKPRWVGGTGPTS